MFYQGEKKMSALIEITAPKYVNFDPEATTIFLAGPIMGAPDWQKQALTHITKFIENVHEDEEQDLVVYNPRRSGVFNKESFFEQIDWDTYHMNKADLILFWMPKEENHDCWRNYAQTTRHELGEWVTYYKNSKKLATVGQTLGFDTSSNVGPKLAIGIQDGFTNKSYITYRLNTECPELVISNDLRDNCENALKQLGIL